jgi:hypothetical protein
LTDAERTKLLKHNQRKRDAKDVLNRFGTVGVVLFYRSQQHGTEFDMKKSKRLVQNKQEKSRWTLEEMISHCLTVVGRSFEILEAIEHKETKEAYQALEMIYKIFPKDNSKLRRIALKKLIPNLLNYLSSIDPAAAVKPAE